MLALPAADVDNNISSKRGSHEICCMCLINIFSLINNKHKHFMVDLMLIDFIFLDTCLVLLITNC